MSKVKLGITSNSVARAIVDGRMTILDVIDWTKQIGGAHLEIVPRGFDLNQQPELIPAIQQKAAEVGIGLSNYVISANLICDSEVEHRVEIERIKKEVDIAEALGIKHLRHDVASRPREACGIESFIRDLPMLAAACREITDYAAAKGIGTSVENHGYYMQASERIAMLIDAVNHVNFRVTLDVGNFMCVDEDSIRGVNNTIALASNIHLKDFYIRKQESTALTSLKNQWIPTANGKFVRGAIVGQGDLDIRAIVDVIRASDYNGCISVEFEGVEDCLIGTAAGLACAKALFDQN